MLPSFQGKCLSRSKEVLTDVTRQKVSLHLFDTIVGYGEILGADDIVFIIIAGELVLRYLLPIFGHAYLVLFHAATEDGSNYNLTPFFSFGSVLQFHSVEKCNLQTV